MAKKPEYIVANGCLQEGSRLIFPGDPYSPATPALAARLVAKKKLVKVGKAESQFASAGEGAADSEPLESDRPVAQPEAAASGGD